MKDVEKLLARVKIEEKLYCYCRSIDQKNWEGVRSCFAAEHVHKHGSYTGDLDGFIKHAKPVVNDMHVGHHSISNLLINISDDLLTASSEAYFTAIHKIDGSKMANMKFFTKGIKEVDSDWIVAGYYNDRWTFRDGQWLIIERNARHVWERVERVTPEPL